jgi:hypothetical protein
MQSKSIRRERRRFLKLLGMVTGAGALLALGDRGKTPANEAADTGAAHPRVGQGYRLTEHIRSYYHNAGL